MSRVADYGFTIARLRARIGLMRDSQTIDNMIKAPSLSECINVLFGTRHNGLVEVYSKTGDLQQVELYLFSEEVENYKTIIKELPNDASLLLSVLLEKLEIENLKNALRLWYSDVVRHHSLRYRASYLYKNDIVNVINWNGIINAPTYNDVLKVIEETPYYEVLSSFSYEMIASKGLFDLEIALDQHYFKLLFSAIEKLPKADSVIAEKLYTVDVDLKNILLLIRYGYYHSLSSEEIEKTIIPYGYIYNELMKSNHIKDKDLLVYIKRVVKARYPELVQEIDDIRRSKDDLTDRDENADQILLIESYLGKIRKKEYSHMLVSDPFSIGIVLAYCFLENQENTTIRAILSAKYYKWSEEKIREAIAL